MYTIEKLTCQQV